MDKQASDPLILQPPSEREHAIDVRLECLKLATMIISGPHETHHAAALRLAEQYAAFVLGTKG